MTNTKMSIFIAGFILFIGLFLGMYDFNIDLRLFHTIVGFSFIFIVIFGLKSHYQRLIQSSTDVISWVHVFIFSFLLFISIRALRHWYFTKKKHS